MLNTEGGSLRMGMVWDPAVKGLDTTFWHGDTANPTFDTTKNALKIGDTALVGSLSSFNQYLFGDFEFAIATDSLSPDSNDSIKFFGLLNAGDTLKRGAAYFDMSYDTTAGDSSISANSLYAVVYDEQGVRQRKPITWDSNLGGGGRVTRYRISWEADGYTFLINDTVVATLGDRTSYLNATSQINTSIPQAIRLVNRSLDTTDTNCTNLRFLAIRNAGMINERKML